MGLKSNRFKRGWANTRPRLTGTGRQKMGDIFAELKTEADVMYRNLSVWLQHRWTSSRSTLPTANTPGWYYPVIFHPEFEGPSKKLMGKDALEQQGFVRATTPAGYTKGQYWLCWANGVRPRCAAFAHETDDPRYRNASSGGER